jgi:hypothetical protein
MTRKLMAVIVSGLICSTALAQSAPIQSSQVCRAWQYISAGQAVFCNTCCYGGNCSTSCKQP